MPGSIAASTVAGDGRCGRGGGGGGGRSDGRGKITMMMSLDLEIPRRDLFRLIAKRALTSTLHFAELPKCLPFISVFILFFSSGPLEKAPGEKV